MKLEFTSLSVMLSVSATRVGAHAGMLLLVAAFLSLASFAGAGSSNSTNASVTMAATTAGSCNNTASGFCNEFTGPSYKSARVKETCKGGQGMMYLSGACPTEGRIGTCLVYKGKSTESKYRYYTNFPGFGIKPAGGVAVAAENQCTKHKGEWTPN
jgi:hypothetical protein